MATFTPITLASNTAISLVVSNTGTIGWNLTLAKQVVGPGSLTVVGGPDTSLYLAHIDNTYSGGTIVNGGATLTLGGTGSSYLPAPDATMATHYVATVVGGVITQSTLGTGSLTLENGSTLQNWKNVGSNVVNPTILAGIACLNNSITLAGSLSLGSGTLGVAGLYNTTASASVSGSVSDVAAQHAPLVLASAANALTFSPTSSTYSGGTVVDVNGSANSDAGNYAGVSVAAIAVLGTGGLSILPGGKIRLTAAGNLASAAPISMTSNGVANAVLALAYDALPNLTSISSGIIGIDAANSSISNEAALGNGSMFLGTVMGGSLNAPTLSPAAGNLYRLGGGGPGITSANYKYTLVVNSLLADANSISTSLQVGNTSWFGGASGGGVSLTQANTFSGTIDVYGPAPLAATAPRKPMPMCPACCRNGETAVGASPFGSSTASVNLHNGVLQLNGASGGQAVTKGALTFEGASRIVVNATSGDYPTALTFASIGRPTGATATANGSSTGILLFSASQGLGGTKEQLVSTAGVAMDPSSGTLVAPYMLYGTGGQNAAADFMTYGTGGLTQFTAYQTGTDRRPGPRATW